MNANSVKTERLYLLDGMALAYRAYYAFIQRPLLNAKGENTSAVFGFVTFLNRILSQEYPDHIAVVFDTSKPTFRHLAYPEYKATRQKMPEDMSSQLGILKEVVRAYNIPVIELEGYEADDVIGTLARRAEKEGVLTFLVTSDKDFMQLVTDKIRMYKPGKQGTDVEIITQKEVKDKFGVAPGQVVDVLGLTGDSSDNVPGVPGVGEKTAIPLIQQYGSIENVYDNIDKISQKGLRAKLESNKELAFLSKRLVTIDTNAPVKIDFHTLRAGKKDIVELARLFETLNFKSLLARLKEPDGQLKTEVTIPANDAPVVEEALVDITSDRHTYTLITNEQDFKALCAKLSKAAEFVFDTETTSTDALNAELVGISFALQSHKAFYVSIAPVSGKQEGELFGPTSPKSLLRGLDAATTCSQLKPIFENPLSRKIGHNLKYDMLVLSQYGIEVAGAMFDTMVASYVIRADARHNMDDAAIEYLKYKTVSYTDLTGSGKNQIDIRDVDPQALSDYSCEDADITFRLYEVMKPKLAEQGMFRLCDEVEFPLVAVLSRMERAGVAIDTEFLRIMSKELERQLQSLTTEIHRIAGEPFNINSTQQLGEVLFDKLKLPTVRKTKTGFSTDVGVLETLQHQHPIIDKLLEYRQLTKLKSTYVDALPLLIHPDTQRVHTSFNQTVAATGRLSSSDPNLQNIPIRTELGRSIRKAFKAGRKGSLIMSADYSQIELRVMAHVSGDEGLSEAFRNKEDVHASTAAKVFGVALNDVTRDMRRKAKEVNFGIMYGIGPFGLSSRLEITQSEAKDIIARYFERFPKVKQYINDTLVKARIEGYVSTLLGRRRYLPDLRSANQNIRSNAERQAINMPIQGTAADMIKIAMVNIDDAIRKNQLKSSMLLQVHDELVFEVRKSEETALKSLVEERMRAAMRLSVPIEVDIGVGKTWFEAH
jgi:DNA polymerase-1